MLIERYDSLNLFECIPSLGMQMDPVLAQLDRLLDQDDMFQAVKADLAKRYPQTLTIGRHSTPVEVILRMLVIKHLYGWSFEEAEHFVADSLVLRQTCRVYAQQVPDGTTLIRWAKLIQPATLQTLLDHVTALARQLKVRWPRSSCPSRARNRPSVWRMSGKTGVSPATTGGPGSRAASAASNAATS